MDRSHAEHRKSVTALQSLLGQRGQVSYDEAEEYARDLISMFKAFTGEG